MTYPASTDPLNALTRAFGTEPHSEDHGRIIGAWENVFRYGAYGDGTHSDQAAAQSCIDAVYQAGGGTAYFPPGFTYLLDDPDSHFFALLYPRPGVTVMGGGDGTVFKVGPGLMDLASGYRVFLQHDGNPSGYTDPLTNATFLNFKIDCNGSNNLTTVANRAKGQAIQVRQGSNIRISGVSVVDNAGRQCFSFGDGEFDSAYSVTDVRVTDCLFKNCGGAVTGNTNQNDHSAVYAEVNRFVLTDCIFLNETATGGCSAIETHAVDAVIANHAVDGFGRVLNITASTGTVTRRMAISNITAKNARDPVMWWCADGAELSSISLSDSVFEIGITGTNACLDLDANIEANAIATDLVVDNVTVRSTLTSPGTNRQSGMDVGRVGRLTVSNCTFRDLAGRAISGGTLAADTLELDAHGNRVIECGRTSNSSFQQGMAFNSATTVKSLRLFDNEVIKGSGNTSVGLTGNADVTYLYIGDNRFSGMSTDVSFTGTVTHGPRKALGDLEVDGALNHDGTTVGFYGVTPASRASAYTQTYSTADKTHAAPTAATLTVSDGAGTNDNTIGAITADASVIAAVQEIADEINKLVADVADVKQLVNSVIDDLQAVGLFQ